MIFRNFWPTYRDTLRRSTPLYGRSPGLGDVVAGLVISRIHEGIGHIAEVEVRRDWQRRGIARGLMQRAFSQLHDRGLSMCGSILTPRTGRGARGLYESLGFREVKQHIFYRKL